MFGILIGENIELTFYFRIAPMNMRKNRREEGFTENQQIDAILVANQRAMK